MTAAPRRRILVPIINSAPFIEADVESLRTQHVVTLMRCVSPAEMLRCALASRAHDDLFCWFGSLRFLPVVLAARSFGKRITVVAGGYDVANEPRIDYGNMRGGRHNVVRALGRLLFAAAERVIAVSHATARDAATHARVDPARIVMIHNAVDVASAGLSAPKTAKTPMALTVSVINESTIHRKGLLTVARASRLLPEVPFVIAGRHMDPAAVAAVRAAGGPNLSLPGFDSREQLHALYARAKVYVQPSAYEAFGVSVAEAMLHRCIPVVAASGGLPEVVGDTGYFAAVGDAEGTAAAIRRALAGPVEGSEAARARVIELFAASRRHEALLALMASPARS